MKLLDYIRGTRKGKEAHRLQKEAMRDPFLADAMDGYDGAGKSGATDRVTSPPDYNEGEKKAESCFCLECGCQSPVRCLVGWLFPVPKR